MTALVKETLTVEQVMDLVKQASIVHNKNYDFNDNISISKGQLTTWDDELHEGYIVCHYYKKPTDETKDYFMPTYEEVYEYYFMEVEKEFLFESMSGRFYKPTFHMLLPIRTHTDTSTDNFLVRKILENCKDNFIYYLKELSEEEIKYRKKKNMYVPYDKKITIPLNINDVESIFEPYSKEELAEIEKAKKARNIELLNIFRTTLPPAEDDLWYCILESDIESKVLNILNSKGHYAHIVGEKDSFGWVTRGIEVDGVIVAII